MPTVHSFNCSLQLAKDAGELPVCELVYRKLFSGFQSMAHHPRNGPHQKVGWDRTITLWTGKTVHVDDKFRFNAWRYKDILLEYVSVDKKGSPGWVCKPLLADYIGYIKMPRAIPSNESLFEELTPKHQWLVIGEAFLLPVIQLQQAWARCGKEWIDKYKTRVADNGSYNTLNCPVPVEVLFSEIDSELRCKYEYPGIPIIPDRPHVDIDKASPKLSLIDLWQWLDKEQQKILADAPF
jgi:hypothetical protein